jgi:AraC-like DNA-binding protein
MRTSTPVLPVIEAAGRHVGDATVVLHAHPCPELLLVESGQVRLEVPACGFACAAPAGSLAMLPARRDHRHVGGGRVATAWILLGDRRDGLDDAPRLLPLPADDPALAWFSTAVRLHGSGERSGLEALVAAILARCGAWERRQAAIATHHPAVTRTMRCLEDAPERAWTLAALAREAGVSAPHLADLFRAQLDCTPLQYQTRLRLASAERLLADPYRSVRDVAAALGMEANYFCRLFRRHRGTSPDAWRRERTAGISRPPGPVPAG